jgi:hypothetical protein
MANALITTNSAICQIDTDPDPFGFTEFWTIGNDTGAGAHATMNRVFEAPEGPFTAYWKCTAPGLATTAVNPSLSLLFVPDAQSIATADANVSGTADPSAIEGLFK